MRTLLLGLACLLALCVVTDVAVADPATLGPAWPPPGGVNYLNLNGGEAHRPGGVTWQMYDLDPNAYGDLYYSVNPQYIPSIGSAIGGVESMSLWGWGNGFAEWRTDPGAVRIWDDLANAYRAYTGQFIMRVNETAANGGAAAPAIAPGANGIIPASAGPSFVIGNDEFDTNWQFLLNGVPAGVIFDSIPTSPNDELRTSVGSTFWWNAPVQGVPEPGTMALAVLGLGGLVLVRRRRRA